MIFAIIGRFGPEAATRRPKVRPAHLEHLRPLAQAGRIPIAGPFTDNSGGLIVVDFPSEAEAVAFAHNDPYFINGVFEKLEVKALTKVFPE